MQIDHINISAPRDLLEEVREFYCTILEFQEGFRPGLPGRGYWLYSDNKPLIHLSERADRQPADKRGYLDHIAFRSSDLGTLKDRLSRLGVEYRSSYLEEFNMTQLFFMDPAGTGLEVNFTEEP